jgi:hypothetical protein
MRNRDELIPLMRDLADQITAIVRSHEVEVHDGQPCWLERANVLAYIGHTLGMSADRLHTVGRLMFDYDVHCEQIGGCPAHQRQERPV